MDSIELQNQKKEVFELLKKFITEVLGEDIVDELEITEYSTFTKDLEMDSIEIVALAEKVKNYYNDDMDFNGWVATLDMDQLINLRIIDIINFIIDATNKDK